jgi:YVTN family beta-propeller protein
MKTKLSLILAFAVGTTLALGAATVRIVQTNAAGDSVMLIDPATNKVVGEIKGIEVNHGAAAAPDGSKFYITNEAESTVDVADAKTLAVTKHIPLTNHPNNVAVSKDGKRVYVAIVSGAGAVDVIDTGTLTRVKSIRTEGGIHNTYVTPDGKFVVAGSIPGKKINVIDQKTEEIVWTMPTADGVRPMAFDTNPDGSTKRIFVQLSNFNGFLTVDFATHKIVDTIKLPEVSAAEKVTQGL